MRVPITAIAIAGVLTACAQRPNAGATAKPPVSQRLIPDGYAGRLVADVTVLEDASHGPQMCLNVLTSLPPQCSGPDLVGWSWDDVEHESAQGTRWGAYRITGRFDGGAFTVTDVADPPARTSEQEPRERGEHTPCPEPTGGWQPIDPAKATDAALQAATERARRSSDFAGLWVDQGTIVSEETANDPRKLTLNVSFTGDVDRHTTELREVWGGALCVSQARYSEAQLSAIQQELTETLRPSASGIDVITNSVTVELVVASEKQQKEMDAKYGPGAVVLSSHLRAID